MCLGINMGKYFKLLHQTIHILKLKVVRSPCRASRDITSLHNFAGGYV
jgi:hypothetical protein